MSLTDNLLREDDNKPVKCHNPNCSWAGKIGDTTAIRVDAPIQAWNALAGREGWQYNCPRCGHIVATYYTRMS